MKKILMLALLVLSGTAWSAVSAPANLTVSAYNQDKTAYIYWDEDTTIQNWYIYFGGNLKYSVPRSASGLTSTARRVYRMSGIAQTLLPATITMTAQVPGQPVSSA